jgi:tRNA(Ile)-lysidine synthase
MKDVMSIAKEVIRVPDGSHIVCGVSGGPDSICLLHVLFTLSVDMGFSLSVVHVNHLLRHGDSDADQWFVERLCEEWGVPILSRRIDVRQEAEENKDTLEEAGRKARYGTFDEAAKGQMKKRGLTPDKVYIAVAHNENDQAETILMRIIRGTGTDGLAGMEAERESEAGFCIIRPLLGVERTDIEEYCVLHTLLPRVDHTNARKGPMRNNLRIDLIPNIRAQYNPAFPDALIRLGRIAAEDKAHFDALTSDVIERSCRIENDEDGVPLSAEIPIGVLAGADAALRHRLIMKIFLHIGLRQDCSDVHISLADQVIQGGETGGGVDFPAGYRLELSYENVRFLTPEYGTYADANVMGSFAVSIADLADILRNAAIFDDSPLQMKTDILTDIGLAVQTDGDQLLLDYDALAEENKLLILRTREPGDRISPVGMEGSKKLQDVFVDKKIPREDRSRIILLATENEVLWIKGIRRTRLYPVTESTKNILRITPVQ